VWKGVRGREDEVVGLVGDAKKMVEVVAGMGRDRGERIFNDTIGVHIEPVEAVEEREEEWKHVLDEL